MDRRGTLIRVTAGVGVAVLVAAVVALALHGSSHADAAPRSETAPSPSTSTATSATLSSEPSTSPLDSGTATRPQLPASSSTLVLGDSLALDVYPYLADLMPDRYVEYAAVVGRDTPATLVALRALPDVPPLVLVSLGTNDLSVDSFRVAAEGILASLGPDRCVVWADVVRPDSIGGGATAINRVINGLPLTHHNVHVLAWSALLAAHPEWLSGDGIHPGQVGAQARAKAFANAAFDCSAFDIAAPRASQQYLAPSTFDAPGTGQHQTAGTTSSPSHTPSASSPRSSSTTSPSASASKSGHKSVAPSSTAGATASTSQASPPSSPPASPAPSGSG